MRYSPENANSEIAYSPERRDSISPDHFLSLPEKHHTERPSHESAQLFLEPPFQINHNEQQHPILDARIEEQSLDQGA